MTVCLMHSDIHVFDCLKIHWNGHDIIRKCQRLIEIANSKKIEKFECLFYMILYKTVTKFYFFFFSYTIFIVNVKVRMEEGFENKYNIFDIVFI